MHNQHSQSNCISSQLSPGYLSPIVQAAQQLGQKKTTSIYIEQVENGLVVHIDGKRWIAATQTDAAELVAAHLNKTP